MTRYETRDTVQVTSTKSLVTPHPVPDDDEHHYEN